MASALDGDQAHHYPALPVGPVRDHRAASVVHRVNNGHRAFTAGTIGAAPGLHKIIHRIEIGPGHAFADAAFIGNRSVCRAVNVQEWHRATDPGGKVHRARHPRHRPHRAGAQGSVTLGHHRAVRHAGDVDPAYIKTKPSGRVPDHRVQKGGVVHALARCIGAAVPGIPCQQCRTPAPGGKDHRISPRQRWCGQAGVSRGLVGVAPATMQGKDHRRATG